MNEEKKQRKKLQPNINLVAIKVSKVFCLFNNKKKNSLKN
jgi:hypothetical protein